MTTAEPQADDRTVAGEPRTEAPAPQGPRYDAVIVGAGFGGMGAAIALRESGYDDLLIVDREDDLGGTWHVNRYPGLAVDIASVTYSYSFAPNPHWSRLYAPGDELKAYADHIADTYDLRRHMRFGAAVEGARWDGRAKMWRVRLAGGEEVTGRLLLTATGFLSQPRTPDIAGMDDFAGTVVHTADWDEAAPIDGARTAIIGTGATAVQLIPELAARAKELTVYQRTPIWVLPKIDPPIPRAVRALFAKVPAAQRAARRISDRILEQVLITAVLDFRRGRWLNTVAKKIAAAHLYWQVRDRRLRRELTPDYDFGCKRPTFSNRYHRTLTAKNVRLDTAGIAEITADGIVSVDGTRTPVDVLVLATGYDIWQVNFPAIEVRGRDDADLGRFWRDEGFQAYEGLAVPGFPNFLTLASPYSYSGLSYFTTIESQMRHIRRLLGERDRRGAETFEVTAEANARFLAEARARLGDSVFTLGACDGARSYYFNQHGEAALLRPTTTGEAFHAARSFPLADYRFE